MRSAIIRLVSCHHFYHLRRDSVEKVICFQYCVCVAEYVCGGRAIVFVNVNKITLQTFQILL